MKILRFVFHRLTNHLLSRRNQIDLHIDDIVHFSEYKLSLLSYMLFLNSEMAFT